MAHTPPLANIPSKKILIYGIVVYDWVGENKIKEKRKPTHVEVHITQPSKSPINLEWDVNQFLLLSKILPYTSI